MKKQPPTYHTLRLAILATLIIAGMYILIDFVIYSLLMPELKVNNNLYREIRKYVNVSLGAALPLLFALPAYYWLRRNRLGKRTEVITALTVTAGSVISSITGAIIATIQSIHFASLGLAVIIYTIDAVIAFLLAVLGAHLAKKLYDRRHGIVVE